MMPCPVRFLVLFGLTVTAIRLVGAESGELPRRTWQIDGVTREARVYVPATATTAATAVIFSFHGHGGNMAGFAERQSLHTLWPEAIVIYPQGLNSATPGDPEGKKPGWQVRPGDVGDRDLKFADAMLASFRGEFRVDDRRIYATGQSNGGFFTYLLWATRPDVFAAFAPCASAGLMFREPERYKLTPKPFFHSAGQKDTVVKFELQEETLAGLRKLNRCGAGQRWGDDPLATVYPSEVGAPVVAYIHPGAHPNPKETWPAIVAFFKAHAKP